MFLPSSTLGTSKESVTDISIVHPVTGVPLGIVITVFNISLEMANVVQDKVDNLFHLNAIRSRRKQMAKKSTYTKADAIGLFINCTKTWRTLIRDESGKETGSRPEIEFNHGEWLSCTTVNARRIYKGLPWLRQQVDAVIGASIRELANGE